MKRIKVLILNYWFHIGGTENAMIGMIKQLIKDGCDVTLLVYSEEGPVIERVPSEVHIKKLGLSLVEGAMLRIYGNSKKTLLLKKIIHKVSQYFLPQNKFHNKLYAYLLKRMPEYPDAFDVVLDFYGYGQFLTAYGAEKIKAPLKFTWYHDENVKGTYKTHFYFKDYNKIFCVSESVKNNMVREWPQYASKTEVFHNLIDTDYIRRKAEEKCGIKKKPGFFCLVSVGRLAPQKGFDVAVAAADLLKQKGVKFRWIVVGDGPMHAQLMSEIRKRNLQDCFFLVGLKKNPYPYIELSDLYVQPSRHEGYCTTIVEAKTLKKPILSSDIPSARLQIEDGKNGFLVELDAEKLAWKIQELIKNPGLLAEVREQLMKEKPYASSDYVRFDRYVKDSLGKS